MAFDTIYAEGQRRYVETFSAYARQFLERMDQTRGRAYPGHPAGDCHRPDQPGAHVTPDRGELQRPIQIIPMHAEAGSVDI